MLENPDFEQDYYCRAAEGFFEIGHDINGLVKWLAYYDRSYYEKLKFYDLVGSVLKFLIEIS